jgi:hypothetical protein
MKYLKTCNIEIYTLMGKLFLGKNVFLRYLANQRSCGLEN